ncbi:hypothetical protein SAMN04487897_10156 [Paenibacillus sp. yr247]|uniref:hypothetical protein n=1 Tax=Paenibacillus sp. yr247 TaxID=1761880 RepID=UPI00088E88BC|nr:hypothetical protein [Paenibacillus sp. yr247]SDM79098.1 hypothetical protein SAMN04487897_10156 [Paenibacillus sp. yr247]
MSAVKLSQHDALMVECLRARGISSQALLDLLKDGKGDELQAAAGTDDFDFKELLAFRENGWELFEQAVLNGYEIKFNTLNGIRYLVRVKYGKEIERKSRPEGDYLDDVELSTKELEELRAVLSKFWTLTEVKPHEVEGLHHIRIALPQ